MAAAVYRAVWLRYGQYQTWHAIKSDVKVMSDLHEPCCKWQGGKLVIGGVCLVPPDGMRICNACLAAVLNVEDWQLD